MRELIVATTAVLSLIAAVLATALPAPRALCMRTGGLPAKDGRCVARSAPAAPDLVAELGEPAPAVLARRGGEALVLQPLLQLLRDDLPADGRGKEVERGALFGSDVDGVWHGPDWSTT